jgi:hypothetical protein
MAKPKPSNSRTSASDRTDRNLGRAGRGQTPGDALIDTLKDALELGSAFSGNQNR